MPYAEAFTRFGVGAALALLTGGMFVLARRHRPRSWWTFLWVAPFLLTVWSGWSTTSWGERYEYEIQCREWWNNGAVTFDPASTATTPTTFPPPVPPPSPRAAPPPATPQRTSSKGNFMSSCIDEQRAHADRMRTDPDSSCDMENRSGCPDNDYRGLWLGISGLAGAAGFLVSLTPVIRPGAPRS